MKGGGKNKKCCLFLHIGLTSSNLNDDMTIVCKLTSQRSESTQQRKYSFTVSGANLTILIEIQKKSERNYRATASLQHFLTRTFGTYESSAKVQHCDNYINNSTFGSAGIYGASWDFMALPALHWNDGANAIRRYGNFRKLSY